MKINAINIKFTISAFLICLPLVASARENFSGSITNIRMNPSGNVGLVVKNSTATKFLWFPGGSALGKNLLATILTSRATSTDSRLYFRFDANSPSNNNTNQSGGCSGFENASNTETDSNSGWYCNEVIFIDYLN